MNPISPDSADAGLAAIEQLSQLADPYAPDPPGDAALFDTAMAACDAHHRAHNPRYAQLWQAAGQRPLIPVGLFKQADLATPCAGPGLWLGSSGTGSGQSTRVFFDAASMARIERGMTQIFLHHQMASATPARFLLLSPDPRSHPQPGYATSFLRFTACAPVAEVVFAVNAQGRFQPEAAWSALRRWQPEAAPVFIFGLTVYFEQLALSAPDTALHFAAPLRTLSGGGYKGLLQQLDRPTLLARLRSALHAPVLAQHDLFGMTEHPLHYMGCAEGRFHIPRYSRLSIVDAQQQALAAGATGLIRLQNPFFAALPSHDLLTEDLGRMGQGCACGNPRPWLEYIGRASSPAHTCADHAAHLR